MKNKHPEIVLPDGELKRELRRRSRRGFLAAGAAAIAGAGIYEWVTQAADDDNLPWPQRRVLGVNEKLAEGYLRESRRMPAYPAKDVSYLKPNGNYGLEEPLDLAEWHLEVKTGAGSSLQLDMADIRALPKTEMTTRFCCIEGWTSIVSWGGVRFADFTKSFFPAGKTLPDYVSMATPGGDYYVGLDKKSALHSQTLLAYERNGQPLDDKHGAPLRLAIPVKYGIKNIKRIGTIEYAETRPDDYWAEEGYDWFAGL